MEWKVGKIYNVKDEGSKLELTQFSPSINRRILDLLDGRPFKVEALSCDNDVSEITIIGEGTEPMTLRESPINCHGVWFWANERRLFAEVDEIPEEDADLTLERLGLLMEAYDIKLIDKTGLNPNIAPITTLEGIKSVLNGMPSRIGAIREYKQTRDRMIQLELRIKHAG